MVNQKILVRWVCWFLLGALSIGAPERGSAQALRPVPARALRSVSPTDTTFAELEFLRNEIGGARVVFLGEPTHGEGDVLAAKTRLVAFLQQRLGFATLGLESGFFELHKAQREIALGKSVVKNLQSSVFPVWMQTREFQPLLPLVGPDGLRVMGFDPQLSGDYSSDLVEDLQDFIEDSPEPDKAADHVDYELLGDVVDDLAGKFAFPTTHTLAEFETQLSQAERLLRRATNSPTAARRTEAVFWQQCLRSLGALARAYATQPPLAARTAADANLRDAQMADNLLWYLRQHPAEKIICWGALPHFANRVGELGNSELHAYQPMGRAVREALGASQVYTLGTLAGGGTHGAPNTAGLPVPPPAPGTLEANLLTLNTPYAFLSLKHDAPGRQLVTYAFDYQPLAGPWSEVVDGFLFLRSVAPPHLTAADSATASTDTTAAGQAARRQPPGSLSPAPGQGRPTIGPVAGGPDVSGVRTVRGVVLDQRSRAAVPYATVLLPGQRALADAQGRFALPLPGPTVLHISSLGYEQATVQSPRGNEELTVLLTPAAYASAALRRASALPDPATLLANVVKNLPTNYDLQAYGAEVYAHRRFSSFDTLRYEAETVGQVRVPARAKPSAKSEGDATLLRPAQRHVLAQQGRPAPPATGLLPQSFGFAAGTADPLRRSPLFVAGNGKRYKLKIDSLREQGTDTLYVLSFVAQRADLRSTGLANLSAYQGRLVVRRRGYAVVHYEALAQVDTAQANATTRRAYARAAPAQRAEIQLVTNERLTHVADYAPNSNGRYYLRRSVGQQERAGRIPGRTVFFEQDFYEQYFRLAPTAALAPAGPAAAASRPAEVPYRPEFWSTYQRPVEALVGGQ